jgi:hypothetical protein
MEDVLETGTQGRDRFFTSQNWRPLRFGALLHGLLPSSSITARSLRRARRKRRIDDLAFQNCREGYVHGSELQLAHCIREAWYSSALKLVVKLTPWMIGTVAQMLPIKKDAALVRT